MGCSSSVSASPDGISHNAPSSFESSAIFTYDHDEKQDQISSAQPTRPDRSPPRRNTNNKVSQESTGFVTVPETVTKDEQSHHSCNAQPHEFSSGLVFTEATKSETQADLSSRVFNYIKRGELQKLKDIFAHELFNSPSLIHTYRGMWDSSPLLVACQYNQVDIVALLLSYPPADLSLWSHVNEKGYTALLFAVMKNMIDLIKTFISYQMEVLNIPVTKETVYNTRYDENIFATPLTVAVMKNHRRCLALLLDQAAAQQHQQPASSSPASIDMSTTVTTNSNSQSITVNYICEFPTVPSIAKQQQGSLSISLRTNSSTIAKQCVKRVSILLLACAYGQEEIIRELVYRLVDIRHRDEEGSNLLHHLARCHRYHKQQSQQPEVAASEATAEVDNSNSNSSVANNIFLFLIHHGCLTSGYAGYTATSTPANTAADNQQQVDEEEKEEDDIYAEKDINGDSPLHIVVEQKQALLVKSFLMEGGCNVSIMNSTTGYTPLHLAIRKKDTVMVELLLEYGADPLRKLASTATAATVVNLLSPLELAQKQFLSQSNKEPHPILKIMEKASQPWLQIRSMPTPSKKIDNHINNNNNNHNNNNNNHNNNDREEDAVQEFTNTSILLLDTSTLLAHMILILLLLMLLF